MRDEVLEMFVEEFGEPTSPRRAKTDEAERYRGVLPDKLLEYWQDLGWSGFADGLFWLVNPADYDHLVAMWLEGTPFEALDTYRVIARTAFGKLYVWGENTNRSFVISCPTHAIIAMENKVKTVAPDTDSAVETFFVMSRRKRYDLTDMSDKPLFAQALKKLGPLGPDEVYGFEPALVAGGEWSVNNLAKLNLDIHLTILRQMAPPEIPFSGVKVDID